MRLVSQSEAADIKGCARQNIQKLSRKTWGFFVAVSGEPDQVDIEHPHWKLYLDGKKPTKEKTAKKKAAKGQTGKNAKPKKTEKPKAGKTTGSKAKPKAAKKKTQGKTGGGKKKPHTIPHELISGTGLDIEYLLKKLKPISLKELKTKAEIQKINVEMHAKLGELIDRRIVDERLSELSRYVQMFVDLDRRLSSRICLKLDRQGMEKEIEKIIGQEVKKIVQDFKTACMKKVSR